MRITAAEAEAYFAHPSQRKAAMLDGPLPDVCEYRAHGGICGAFHLALWPDLWMVHIGAMPGQWGNLVDDARRGMAEFFEEKQPVRIVAWVKESNRAALAFGRRVGFETDGRLPLPEPIILLGWRP